jgi:hypothetical protein
MDMDEIVDRLRHEKYLLLDKNELENILKQTAIVMEKDTMVSGYIRVLSFNNEYLVQELTEKEELMLRLFPSKEDAERFLNERMAVYDQMWDGCGCKVNYYK